MNRFARRFVTTGTAVAVCLAASAALAGGVAVPPVTVATGASGAGYGYGSLAEARSSDKNEYIGCYTDVLLQRAYCFAENSAGKYVTCQTTQPAAVQSVAGINAASYIDFEFDETGTCYSIEIANESGLLP